MHSSIRVAVAQEPVARGDVAANTETAVTVLEGAGDRATDLVVFPECFLSGYMLESRSEALKSAITLDSTAITRLLEACARTGVHAVVGLLERAGERLFNTAVLIGPDGVLGHYRKMHVPMLGADRFVEPGDDVGPRVVSTPIGRIGMMICFDLRFPECARTLALQGAELIAMPTAWPESATFLPELVAPVRALENVVHLVVADRADEEGGIRFLGRSRVIDPVGSVLLDAGTRSGTFETIIDLSRSHRKDLVYIPGEYEVPLFGARRPEHYGDLVAPLPGAVTHEGEPDVRT